MGLIEQAAKRLEELQRAGAEIPESLAGPQREAGRESPPQRDVRRELPPAPEIRDIAPRPRVVHRRHSIDLERLDATGFVTPQAPRSRIAEEFRAIKRPLLSNATPGKATSVANGNRIMVTSSIPGEGKTFTSVNLAMSIAMEVDRRVLLVDADVARPSLPRTLGIQPARGLMDILTGQCRDVGDVILRTDVEKLSFLPAGTMHAGASELLASDAMTRLVAELGERYADRIVLFDSPPLLAANEPAALATHMGQIVFVVYAERTLQADVHRALATIEACPVKLLLLNAASTSSQGAYGYGYGQRYGYGTDRA
ncbi:MAG: XrtA-associated tyrosine autokinase [Betaproteobacteria bacterium]